MLLSAFDIDASPVVGRVPPPAIPGQERRSRGAKITYRTDMSAQETLGQATGDRFCFKAIRVRQARAQFGGVCESTPVDHSFTAPLTGPTSHPDQLWCNVREGKANGESTTSTTAAMRDVTLLIIDDEPQIRRAVHRAVAGEVARVIEASAGRDGIDIAATRAPDIVVLDLGLPDMAGADVCRELRQWSTAPIIVLSARHTDQEKVQLLDAGADDYITKPFSTDELCARVRAQLRRADMSERQSSEPLEIDGLVIDTVSRSVSREGTDIHLTPIEWGLLRTFLSNRGRTLTHTQIFRAVWNQPAGDPQQYLRVHIANLRSKIERDPLHPTLILTEPGVGYRFQDRRGSA
jgi:two-component system, OmpR family, KDP operon response regulator KdpE